MPALAPAVTGLAIAVHARLACFEVVLAAVPLTTVGRTARLRPSTAASAVKLATGAGLLGYGGHPSRSRHRSRYGDGERSGLRWTVAGWPRCPSRRASWRTA
ncbi:hypothetical protein ACH3Y9_10825 [Streptomyces sp. WSLK1-5]|uniref:hypothetical protein n=1 Tax=unclassified Streptomyces TaxID=2593676 RepID=UPI0037B7DFE2